MWIYGDLPNGWTTRKIGDYAIVITDYVANGSFASLAKNVVYKSKPDYAILVRLTDYNNDYKGNFVYIDQHAYEFLSKSKLYGNEIIISNVGANVGTVFRCPKLDIKMSLAPNSIMLKTKGNDDFYYYWFTSKNGQHSLQSIVTGSAQPKFNKTNFRDLEVPVPPLNIQNKIAEYLISIDRKIQLNKQINDNLLQQAQAIFLDRFPSYFDGTSTISKFILPKRGKSFLSKNAVPGPVPVVAGGLEPATYHNVSNTKAPVITISASGANAGYVRLWNKEVWSSDSSYIDDSVTKYVYFWFTLLKIRQQEIFDSQTGSAQPHIYPQHIGSLKIPDFDLQAIKQFNNDVEPLFKLIGKNDEQNTILAKMRDNLLPRLMSGDIDLDSINV